MLESVEVAEAKHKKQASRRGAFQGAAAHISRAWRERKGEE